MLQALTEEQVQEHRRKIVRWVRKVMSGDYGVHITNMLTDLIQLCEQFEREKKTK